jgi:starch synthase
MRILLASSEVHPYSKTGGLADMVGALAKTLARAGHQVGVVTPLYAGIRERFPRMPGVDLPLEFPLGDRTVRAQLWSLEPMKGLTVYFVDQPAFYGRPGLYQHGGADYPDNAERFVFFSKAAAHLALHLDWKPEVLHVHEWQTGVAALLLHHQRQLAGQGSGPGVCLTIHNMAYQGLFPAARYGLTNLPWDYFTAEGVEFYGQMCCLKAGIVYADAVTTVSPRYAREITTEEMGCGLDGVLRRRSNSLVGILNGVDYEVWNPISDPFIRPHFSARGLDGKAANKLALQREFGLPDEAGIPLFGNVGRLAEQKGVEIMLGALEEMLSAKLQFVAVGNGMPAFERAYQNLARRHPAQVGVRIGFDEGLSHRIEAGCDFFLMPSRFEPCGLNQMYGLRYGTIPIVRATGGLDDTVIDPREDTVKANGIKFMDYSTSALAKGIRKALALHAEPELLRRFRTNAMAADFSWDRTMAQYVKVYEKVRKHIGPSGGELGGQQQPDPPSQTGQSPMADSQS